MTGKSQWPEYLASQMSLFVQTPESTTPLDNADKRGYLQLLKPLSTLDIAPANKTTQPNSLTLPTAWNMSDKSNHLEVSDALLRVAYQGPGKSDIDAATVRANAPIPTRTGIFYYEVDILAKGRDGYIAIGFGSKSVALSRLPGWDDMSWGYHGDDGHAFSCSGTGRSYGPTFTTGDTIGCILNLADLSAGYTKNGLFLGLAFKNLSKDIKDSKARDRGLTLFPMIGLRTPGEVVQANFGQRPFKFDIENYYREERLKFLQSIIAPVPRPTISGPGSLSPTSPRSTSSPPSPLQDPKDVETLHTLILSHLIQSGYHDSALAFYKSTRSIASSDIIQKPVSQSTHHSANSTTFDSLPGASSIQLRKAIRQQVSKGDIDSTLSLLSSSSPTLLQSKPLLHFGLCLQKFIELVRAQNGSSAMIVEGGDDGMDVDGQSSPGQKHSSSSSSSEGLLQVIEYGKQVQTQFSSLLLDANVYEAMTQVFSLMCYETPESSPVSYLLDKSAWDHLADAINTALLELHDKQATSLLELCYKQTMLAHKELLDLNLGSAALVNVDRDCLLP